MSDLIQLRGGTFSILNYLNIVYAEREVVLELDTGRFKVGDGTSTYTELDYFGIEFLTQFFDHRYAPISPTWFRRFATADRPDAGDVDVDGPDSTYFDTDLGKPGWSNGTDWVDATGTTI